MAIKKIRNLVFEKKNTVHVVFLCNFFEILFRKFENSTGCSRYFI